MRRKLTYIDKAIIKALAFSFRDMTAHEIGKKTGISWVTVKKHMPKLVHRGLVASLKAGSRVYYELGPRLYVDEKGKMGNEEIFFSGVDTTCNRILLSAF